MQRGRLVRVDVPRHLVQLVEISVGVYASRWAVAGAGIIVLLGDPSAPADECPAYMTSSVCFGDAEDDVYAGRMDPVEAFWNTDFAETSAEAHFRVSRRISDEVAERLAEVTRVVAAGNSTPAQDARTLGQAVADMARRDERAYFDVATLSWSETKRTEPRVQTLAEMKESWRRQNYEVVGP